MKWNLVIFILVMAGIWCAVGACYNRKKMETQDCTTQESDEEIFDRAISYCNIGNYSKAVPLFRGLAEKGYASVQFRLGGYYFLGQGVTQDYEQAIYWYRQAADQGYASAQFALGGCYYYGRGVIQDYEQAAYWYTRAAENGNGNAMIILGHAYEFGVGVEKNCNKALYWYKEGLKSIDADEEWKILAKGNVEQLEKAGYSADRAGEE